MKKVTLLTFSRNDVNLAIELVNTLHEHFNEIVIIDSSDKELHLNLLSFKNLSGLSNLKIFYTVPLGYPDMLRPYAFTKCLNDWILLVDCDERPSKSLLDDLEKLVESDQSDVYGIYRYQWTKNGKSILRSEQVRLFNKQYFIETGIIHEKPKSSRRYMILPDNYYYIHLQDRKQNRRGDYSKAEVLRRLSYSDLPKIEQNTLKPLMFFQNRKDEEELHSFQYFIHYLIKEVYSSFITRNFSRFFKSITNSLRMTRLNIEFKNMKDSDLLWKISRIIRKEGLVKFLRFEDPSEVERVTAEFQNSELKGSDLLLYLLKRRYMEITVKESQMKDSKTFKNS